MGNACCKSDNAHLPVPIEDTPFDKALNPVPGGGGTDSAAGGLSDSREARENTNNLSDVASGINKAAVAAGVVGLSAAVANVGSAGTSTKAGEAILLEASKGLPFLAPVAFLVAAIANAANDAVIMKQDCYEFRRVVMALEKVLMKAQNLVHHKDDIEHIREILEEALALVGKFQKRGWVSAIAAATGDLAKLEDIKQRLSRTLQQMQLASQVDMEVFQTAKFKQAEELKKQIEEHGGAAACAADPEKMSKLEKFMDESDKLLIAKLEEAAKEQSEHKLMHRKSLSKMDEALLETQKLQECQQDMRTDINSKFAEMQREAEVTRLRNELLERQVGELRGLLTDIKGMMTKFPVPPSEPQRLLKVHETGVMGMSKDAEAYGELERLAFETFEKFEGQAMVGWNFLDEDKSFMPIMFTPGGDVNADDGSMLKKANIANGAWQPRKANICQHVVASGAPVTFEGLQNMPPMATFDELKMVADKGYDKGIKDMLAFNEGNGAQMTDEQMQRVGSKDSRIPAFPAMLEMMAESGNTMFYHGQPIKLDGETLGSYCIMGPVKPEKFEEIQSSGFIEKIVEKGSEVLKEQARIRRERHLAQLQMMMNPMVPTAMQAQAAHWHQMGIQAMPPAGVPMNTLPMMMGADQVPMINPAYQAFLAGQQPMMPINPLMPPSRAQLEFQMAQMAQQNQLLMQMQQQKGMTAQMVPPGTVSG